MDDGDALRRAIVADPDEDTPRLALADLFDEQSRPDRAELVRLQVELAGLPPPRPLLRPHGVEVHPDPDAEEVEWWDRLPRVLRRSPRRVTLRCEQWPDGVKEGDVVDFLVPAPERQTFAVRLLRGRLHVGPVGPVIPRDEFQVEAAMAPDVAPCPVRPKSDREGELLAGLAAELLAESLGVDGWLTGRTDARGRWLQGVDGETGCPAPQALYRRGFAEEVRAPGWWWDEHGAAVLAANPVRRLDVYAPDGEVAVTMFRRKVDPRAARIVRHQGRVSDRDFLGRPPGALQLVRVEGRPVAGGRWDVEFRFRPPPITRGSAAHEFYGRADFAALLDTF
jgi:uncharacterized protein (TIGR02996 family)